MKALDIDTLLNWPFRDVHVPYEEERSMLYALCIGLGHDPCDERQLRYVYEPGLKTFPTQGLVLGLSDDKGFLTDERIGIDLPGMLHAQTGVQLHKPLPVFGEVTSRFKVERLADRGPGKGTALHYSRTLHDRASGELLFTETGVYVLRGNSVSSSATATGRPAATLPRVPAVPCDQSMELATLPQSALLFRLAAGDKTPLHASPAFAREAGFDRPLLHGICSFGVAAHGLAAMLCGYDGDRMRSIDARYTAPVFPGDILKVEAWRTGPGTAAFRATALPRGVVVLDNGVCEYTPAPV